ncbi:uncharacterized protein LOC133515364 [Cydia pomonella]|uniref:uncharacterized protein LOC133515364 n=1 Tax=Cydia pomonella TaxID=82600 RepID=UPI002ADDE3D8|nr:uncharacterized protein LOC133515364 [Cydia pomonella]
MRRVDRIFGALVDTTPKTICNDKNGENSDSKLFASKACYDKNEKNDENRHKSYLDMQAEKVLERKQDQITSENVTKHSKQPVLELLTSNIEINDMMMIDSPLAPLFSPLTPLINRKDDKHRNQSSVDMQTEKAMERKQGHITSENVTKHSKQPVLELTSNIQMNDMMLIDSPLAPLYSPLTPLINRMDDEHRDQST